MFALALLSTANSFDDVDEPSMTSSVYVSDCRSCWNREAKRYHDIETIKATILRKLRLTRPPNITVPSRPPNVPFVQQYLEDDEMMSDGPRSDPRTASNVEDTDGMTTLRIIHFALPGQMPNITISFSLSFDLLRVIPVSIGLLTEDIKANGMFCTTSWFIILCVKVSKYTRVEC